MNQRPPYPPQPPPPNGQQQQQQQGQYAGQPMAGMRPPVPGQPLPPPPTHPQAGMMRPPAQPMMMRPPPPLPGQQQQQLSPGPGMLSPPPMRPSQQVARPPMMQSPPMMMPPSAMHQQHQPPNMMMPSAQQHPNMQQHHFPGQQHQQHPSMQHPQQQQPPNMMMMPGNAIPGPQVGSMDQLSQQMSRMSTSSGTGLIGAKSPAAQIRGPPPVHPPSSTAPLPLNDINYSRCTLGKIPRNSTLLGKMKIPLAVTISPYPKALRGKECVPMANTALTLSQIVRCRRCRSYLNPYVEMLDQGARWKCNLCFVSNDFPPNYEFDSATNTYVDRHEKVELKHPVYEFVAPVEYMVRPPQPPAYLFVIDVSWSSVSSGFLAVCSKVIQDSLDLLPNEHGRTKVGFIGIDSHMHYFSFDPELQTQVVSDVLDEQSVPFADNVMVNLLEKREAVAAFLGKLPNVFKSTQKPSTCLCAGLDAANRILAANGGKVVCLLSTLGGLPEGNERALKNREDPKARGKDANLLAPATLFYKMIATEASKNQVCFDMFVAPAASTPDNPLSIASGYVDVATLGSCTRYTGGRLEYYPGFNAAANGELASKFASDLSAFLSHDVGMEAVIRVRATQGITFNSFYGSFFLRSADLLALPNVNLDNSYTAVGTLDEALPVPFACVQTAVLYTSCKGERMIRVINTALPVADNYRELFEAVDTNALMDVMGKMAADRLLKGGSGKYEDVRDWVMKQAVDTLTAYRTCLGMGSNPQLQLCDSLRPLPLLCLALQKSGVLSPEPVPVDLRAARCLAMLQGSVEDNVHMAAPYFASIGDWLLSGGGNGGGGKEEEESLPMPLPLSSEHLDRSGAFILYDGSSMAILLGTEAPAPLKQMFSPHVFTNGYALGMPAGERAKSLIKRLADMHAVHPLVVTIADNARERVLFTARLVEDKGPMELPSYGNFLLTLREKSNQ